MSIQQQQQQLHDQPLATIDSPISTTTTTTVEDDNDDDEGGDMDDPLTQSSFSTLNPASHSTSSLPENCTLASSKDNAYFHALFKSVPEHDRLLEIYKCALHRDILLQGHLYLSENYVCFHANIFGWITNLVIEYNEIVLIERKMTAMIIPNGIQINTQHAKHTFASFIFREAAYQQLISLWTIHKPHQLHSTAESSSSSSSSSSDDDDDDDECDSSDTNIDSIQHHHHHHDKDTTSTSRYWKAVVVILLLLHSAWMIRQWMQLEHRLQVPEGNNVLAQPHHIYSRLDHLRHRMEALNQQILEQQLLLYDLSPPPRTL
ncbi:hypothetical protein [Absidia glauca]|uniref:GRAM domain-containing protein n=1 Tax=Absidia glauca TaxID=4829 RepID=A0A168LWS8_ABSGL|nr:hypothetical protein [Absidia glauca]